MNGVTRAWVVGLISLASIEARAAGEGDVAAGQALAEQTCSACHAVGREDSSTHPSAPPFRELGQRYPVETLAEALAEGLVTGHPGMPQVEWEPQQIEAFIAYLRAIQTP